MEFFCNFIKRRDDTRLETEQEEGQEQDGHLCNVRLSENEKLGLGIVLMVCVLFPLIAADALFHLH